MLLISVIVSMEFCCRFKRFAMRYDGDCKAKAVPIYQIIATVERFLNRFIQEMLDNE